MTTGGDSAGAEAARLSGGFSQKFPTVLYFLMAYGFTWIAVTPILLARAGVLQIDFPVELIQIVGALAGPALAGVIVAAVAGGRTEVGLLLSRVVQWRVNIVWYAVMLFGPLLTLTLTATFFLGPTFLGEFVKALPLLPSRYLPVLILGVIVGPLWEEIGWRGVALPRLQRRIGPLVGTVVLGALWAIWHLPGYIGGWLGAFTPSAFLALLVGSIGFSILMTWIYNHTDGSLLIMILFHSAGNAAIAFGGPMLPSQMSPGIGALVRSGWIPGITYAAWGLILVVVTRGRLAYRADQA